MYVETVPNRNSPPAILLREAYREDGKVKKRTLANLTDWPKDLVEGFRALLKGGKVIAAEPEAVSIRRSLPHGHVAAALERCGRPAWTASSDRPATAAATSSSPWW